MSRKSSPDFEQEKSILLVIMLRYKKYDPAPGTIPKAAQGPASPTYKTYIASLRGTYFGQPAKHALPFL